MNQLNLYFSPDSRRVRLTLTISNITQEMLSNKYECVVSRVDVISVYNESLKTYDRLHSTDTPNASPRGVVLRPNMSATTNLEYYANGTEGVCTRNEPCVGTAIFQLQPPFGKSTLK